MERKTQVHAEEGKQYLTITREFDIPVELLFQAHTDAAIISQWMGTKVLKLESKKNGSWHYETSDPQGNILFQAHGVFHEFIPNKKIVRTFQMMHENFDVQLEFLDFEALTEETSRLTMYFVYKSEGHRAEQLKLPFKQGLNWAHDALEKVAKQLKPAR
jgi:uncharacterized protein YndB with AHSA1/START domain